MQFFYRLFVQLNMSELRWEHSHLDKVLVIISPSFVCSQSRWYRVRYQRMDGLTLSWSRVTTKTLDFAFLYFRAHCHRSNHIITILETNQIATRTSPHHLSLSGPPSSPWFCIWIIDYQVGSTNFTRIIAYHFQSPVPQCLISSKHGPRFN